MSVADIFKQANKELEAEKKPRRGRPPKKKVEDDMRKVLEASIGKEVIESLKPFEKRVVAEPVEVVAEEIEEAGELESCVDIEVVARSAQLVGMEAYRW